MLSSILSSRVFQKLKVLLSKPLVQLMLVFIFAILLRFYPFLRGQTLIFGDNYSLMVPGKLFTAHWLRQGILPLWNPNIFAGLPWIGDVNQSVLYPTTLLFMVLHPAAALNLSIVLHLFISVAGMYFLLKKINTSHFYSLLGAVLWMLSTQLAGSIHNLSTIQSLVWLPWIVFFSLKIFDGWTYKICFAFMVMLQFAGGYPQHVIYAIAAGVISSLVFNDFIENKQSGSFVINRDWLRHWLLTGLLTVILSAVIWLPFMELLINSTRMEQTIQQASVGSLHPLMLVRSIIPNFFDKQTAGFKWGPAWSGQPNVLFYVTWIGLLSLFLPLKKSLLTKKYKFINRFIYCLIGFTLFFALGSYIPGFELVQESIPFFKIGRYPSMTLILTNMFLIILLIRRLPFIELSDRFKKWLVRLSLAVVVSVLLIGIISFLDFPFIWHTFDNLLGARLSSSGFHTLDRDRIIVDAIWQNLLVSSSLFFLSLISLIKNKKKLLLIIFILDMVYATQGMFIFAPARVYDPETINLRADFSQYRLLTRNSNKPYTDYGSYWEALIVRSPFSDSFVDDEEFRSFEHPQRLRMGLTPDWNMVNNYPVVHGYTTLLPKDYAQIWSKSSEPRINFIDYIDSETDQDLLQEWSVKYYLVDNWFDVGEDLSHLQAAVEEGYWELYELPALPRFRFADGRSAQAAPENLKINENPNQIELSFENVEQASALIIADRYDHNWTALVKDQEVKLEEYNHMRRIPIEPGLNKIKLIYRPKYFYYGAMITVFGLLISVGGIVIERRCGLAKLSSPSDS